MIPPQAPSPFHQVAFTPKFSASQYQTNNPFTQTVDKPQFSGFLSSKNKTKTITDGVFNNGGFEGTLVSPGDLTVTDSPKLRQVESDGELNLKNSSVAELAKAQLDVQAQNCHSIGRVEAGKDTKLKNTSINGTLEAMGDLELVENSRIGSDVNVSGNAYVDKSTIDGVFYVGGTTLTAQGESRFKEVMLANGDLLANQVEIHGDLTSEGSIVSLKDSFIQGNTIAKGSIELEDTAPTCSTMNVGSLYSKTGNIKATGVAIHGPLDAPEGVITLSHCHTDGAVSAEGDIVAKEAKVASASSKKGNIELNRADSKGAVSAPNGTVKVVYGDIQGDITAQDKVNLENESLAMGNVTVRGANAVVEIKGNSRVDGDITFPDGGGLVAVEPGCRVEGKIKGGHLVNDKQSP